MGASILPRMSHTWTIAEAKARLSEILRLASSEGPQRIGTKQRYVLVPEAEWARHTAKHRPLGAWLIENMPRAGSDDMDLELPDRRDPPRPDPFEPEAPVSRDGRTT
jgi:hypothetical protein